MENRLRVTLNNTYIYIYYIIYYIYIYIYNIYIILYIIYCLVSHLNNFPDYFT